MKKLMPWLMKKLMPWLMKKLMPWLMKKLMPWLMKKLMPWLLLPSVVLALSSVTLLAPHQAALAGPPPTQAAPQAPEGDGDGDELLEHWGDPQFSNEEQKQMAGMAAGFLLLGAAAGVRRSRRSRRTETVLPASETDSLSNRTDTRKAA